MRVVNVLGGTLVTLVVMWQTGMMSRQWWDRFTAPTPVPIAKAPKQLPSQLIGLAPVVPRGNDSSMSPIALHLFLTHVDPGRTVTEGTAAIGVVKESPQIYQAGALLENGAQLAEIHSDYVVLRRDGRSARLYLDGVRNIGTAGDASLLAVGGPKERPLPAPVTSRETLTDYIRPTPIFEGDRVVGYQVFAGAKSGPFLQMGLKPGDVIVELGGVAPSDPNMMWEAFRQLAQGTSLGVTIKRGAGLEHFSIDGMLIVRAEESNKEPTQAMLAPVNQ